MTVYEAVCSCGFMQRRPSHAGAEHALRHHVCRLPVIDLTPTRRCDNCTGLFPMLIDDGALCLRCDALLFPSTEAAA